MKKTTGCFYDDSNELLFTWRDDDAMIGSTAGICARYSSCRLADSARVDFQKHNHETLENRDIFAEADAIFAANKIKFYNKKQGRNDDEDEKEKDEEEEEEIESLIVNIGGQRFEVLIKTLQKQPKVLQCILNDGIRRKDKLTGRPEYFFDRDAEIFRFVLLYCRLGQMHVPTNICGPILEQELDLWGLQVGINLERCCFGHVMETKVKLMSLQRFEDAFNENEDCIVHTNRGEFGWSRKWQRIQHAIWNVVDRPDSSIYASLYAMVLSLTVILAVIVFVAKTAMPESVFYDFHNHVVILNTSLNVSATSDNTLASTKSFTLINGSGDEERSAADVLTMPTNDASSRYTSSPIIHQHTDKSPTVQRSKSAWFEAVDYVCIIVFSFDFTARLMIAPRKWHHLRNTYTIIDLLSVLPFFLEKIGPKLTPHYDTYEAIRDFTVGSMFEFLKISLIFRLLRIGRHYMGLQVLIYTLKTSVKDLLLMVVFVFLGTLFFATMLYFLEKKHQIKSIPIGFWWAIITMTTVGYGDYYPITTLGMGVGCCCAMSGVLLIAFTVPILVNHFMLYYQHAQIVDQSKSVHRLAQQKLLDRMKYVKKKVARQAILKNVKHFSTTLMQGRFSGFVSSTDDPDDTVDGTADATVNMDNCKTPLRQQCASVRNSDVSCDRDSFHTVGEATNQLPSPLLCSRCRHSIGNGNLTA